MPLPDLSPTDVPATPDETGPPDSLSFTSEEAESLGMTGAAPGSTYNLTMRISSSDEMGITAEPLSAEMQDAGESSEESVEPPKDYGEKPKPAIKGPKAFAKPLPM